MKVEMAINSNIGFSFVVTVSVVSCQLFFVVA